MELQALLVLCGIGVVGAAVLLLMGLFSASGTSYEEAMAQQRKATTELLALAEGKNKPKKNLKKANKKLAKKERHKENVPTTTGSDPDSEAQPESGVDEELQKPHVEFSPEVIVDVSRDAPPIVKIRKRGNPKIKPILVNKEDPSCISDPSTPPSPVGGCVSNHFEEIHPKDDFELLQSSILDKSAEKKEDDKKDVKNKQVKSKTLKSEPIKEKDDSASRERHNSGDVVKDKKAKKTEKKLQEEVDTREEPAFLPPVQPSEIVAEKVVKQLNTPQQTPPGKGKKKKQDANVLSLMAGDAGGVNVSELVRLVTEAVLSRTEIQELTDALLNKQHDQLPQHSEWSEGPNDPMLKLKKQLADKEKALADEVEASQALHAKLKELRASLNMERTRGACLSRTSEETAAELATAAARLQRLTDEHHVLQQEKMMLQSKLGSEAEHQAQRVQMEMHIQRLSESENALVGQLQALQAEVAARALEAGQARDTSILAQQHATELAHQLQEANRVCAELDAQRQSAIHAESAAHQEIRQLQERLNAMSDLQNEVQRLTSRAQVAESNVEKLKEESEKQKQQLSSELSTLKEQLALRDAEMAELKQLKAAPAQNGLPASNLTDQHKAAELSKVEGVIECLKAELASAQKIGNEQKEQVARLQEQLKQYQDKNNGAITKAQIAQYNEIATILKGACPKMAPSTTPSREWLEAFAASLKKELEKKPVEVVDDSKLDELRLQNEQLQGLVDKYKSIIDDTEGVLSRLQQNVTAEEQRWAQQLADKQRELDELRLRTITQLQHKIDSLEAELRQAKANKNHTFADNERLTEERLLGGFSDKHKLDSLNGPLKVGLEEK